MPLGANQLINNDGRFFAVIGEDKLFWRGDFQIGNPSFKCFDFLGRELFFWRHVRVGIDLNNLVKRTCLGIPWNEGSVGLAAFESGSDSTKIKATFLFYPTVAFSAVFNDDRVDLRRREACRAEHEHNEGA